MTVQTGMLSLAEPCTLEIDKIKGSRFIGYAQRAANMDAMQTLLAEVRAEHPNARHWCFGWRGRDVDQHRSSDDGEPRGSGGPPILRAIEGFALFETGVVVVRYFGGTKLGVGGLIRAYGGCARSVLDAATFVTHHPSCSLDLRFAHGLIGTVNACLQSHGIRPGPPRFGVQVELRVELRESQLDRLCSALRDACSGQIEIAPLTT